jgi:SAM-dependent methyltransferase
MAQIRREEGRRLFGTDPAGYDRARPGHADRVYRVLVETCGLGPSTRGLEIGPGTGQATRRVLELGADLVAIEPDSALADYLALRTKSSLIVLNEPLEDVELPDEAFDLAIAASSFHWVDEDPGLSKIFAALRPGGSVALWWTLFGDDERPDRFHQALSSVLDSLYATEGIEPERSPSAGCEGRPRFALDVEARRAAVTLAGFDEFEHELISWTQTWDTARIRTLYATFSPILRLESATRAAILDAVAEVADRQFGGRVELPLLTSLYTARRPPLHDDSLARSSRG